MERKIKVAHIIARMVTGGAEENTFDAIVLAVAHKEYVDRGWERVTSMFKNRQGVVVDVKCVLDKSSCPENVTLWRL